jgi:hypothetical protein
MNDETPQTAPQTATQARIEQEHRQRHASKQVAVAYHLSKGLSELMSAIVMDAKHLPDHEHHALATASHHAHAVFVRLNSIILDYGNQPPGARKGRDPVRAE